MFAVSKFWAICGFLAVQVARHTAAIPIDASDITADLVDDVVETRSLSTVPSDSSLSVLDPRQVIIVGIGILTVQEAIGLLTILVGGTAVATYGISTSGLVPKNKNAGPGCFNSGSWSTDDVINGVVPAICSSGFDYTMTNGTTQPCAQTLLNGNPILNEAGDNQTLAFSATFQEGTIWNNADSCRAAFREIMNSCYGKHSDTQGGWYTYSDGTATYFLDPQTYCGKKGITRTPTWC
ncbi:MAG: hypothetical protein M1827_000267 [Pycnora praestabilis]|nr:MAG: hypothetical protein M1827_000267 [Pycnora praestabilis]